MPVMDKQPVLRIRVDPTASYEDSDQLGRIFTVIDRQRNILVTEKTDISAWALAACEMPDRFHEPDSLPGANVQAPTEPLHFHLARRRAHGIDLASHKPPV